MNPKVNEEKLALRWYRIGERVFQREGAVCSKARVWESGAHVGFRWCHATRLVSMEAGVGRKYS